MKKVTIRRFDREPIAGFVNPQTYLQADGVEVMTVAGEAAVVPYGDVKFVAFVKEFSTGEPTERKLFTTRPKTEGLWVRLHLQDDELMDGILSNNLLQTEMQGFTISPPDANSNTQRLFVPRSALKSMQVVGVVGSPLRTKKSKPAAEGQGSLFE